MIEAGQYTHYVSVRPHHPAIKLAKGGDRRAIMKRALGVANGYKASAGIDIFDNTISSERSVLNTVLWDWIVERVILEANKEMEATK